MAITASSESDRCSSVEATVIQTTADEAHCGRERCESGWSAQDEEQAGKRRPSAEYPSEHDCPDAGFMTSAISDTG